MSDAARVVQKAHRANSGKIAPAPIEAQVVEAHVVEARVVEARVVAVAPGPEPTLTEQCAFLKEQLGLEGSIPVVIIAGACRALGVDEAGSLVERARRCRAAVGGGLPAAGAAPSAPPSHRGGGAPIHCEVLRDDSARKLQGLQRQRIARAKAQEARVLEVQRAARAQMQDRKVVVAPPCDKKLFVWDGVHRTYEEHERRAKARGMVLATIASPEENLDARVPLNKQTAFIGAIRHGTGTGPGAKHWRWADGAAWGYANWARGEDFHGKNRARIAADGSWHGVKADGSYPRKLPALYHTGTAVPAWTVERDAARASGSRGGCCAVA